MALNGKRGPNIFADPASVRNGFEDGCAGEIGQRNGIRGDGFETIDMSLGETFLMPYSDHYSM